MSDNAPERCAVIKADTLENATIPEQPSHATIELGWEAL